MRGSYIWIADGVDAQLHKDFSDMIHKLNQINYGETQTTKKKITMKGSLEEAVRDWIRKKNQELMLIGSIKR